MIKLDLSEDIKAPVERVFAYMSDFRKAAEWQQGVIESSQTPDGPTQLGTKVKTVRTLMGQRLEATAEVTEFVANKKLAFKTTSGPMQFALDQTYEPTADGTRVTAHVEMEASGFLKIAEGAMAGNMKKQLGEDSKKVKEILES